VLRDQPLSGYAAIIMPLLLNVVRAMSEFTFCPLMIDP